MSLATAAGATRVFVTGGTGFVGSHLTRELKKLGHEVAATGNRTEQPCVADKLLEPGLNGIDWKFLRDFRPQVLFHQAANNDTVSEDWPEMYHANVIGPLELFHRCLDAGCRSFVYASSTAVYGNLPVPYRESDAPQPLNPYAESKALFEIFARQFGLDYGVSVVGLRYCNVVGPGDEHKGRRAGMVTQIYDKIVRGEGVRLYKDGEQRRDYIHVSEVVRANLMAAGYDGVDVFNCGSGESLSFNKLLPIIRPYGKGWVEWVDNPRPKAFQNHTLCDMTKAGTLLGFRPRMPVDEQVRLAVYQKKTGVF